MEFMPILATNDSVTLEAKRRTVRQAEGDVNSDINTYDSLDRDLELCKEARHL